MKKHEKWSGVKISKDELDRLDKAERLDLIGSFIGLCASIGLVVIIIVLFNLVWGW